MPTMELVVRYSFFCPVCHNVDDGELIVSAKTGEEALQRVRDGTLICDFCSAEVPVRGATVHTEAA